MDFKLIQSIDSGNMYHVLKTHDRVDKFRFGLQMYAQHNKKLNDILNWGAERGFLTPNQIRFASNLINQIEQGKIKYE